MDLLLLLLRQVTTDMIIVVENEEATEEDVMIMATIAATEAAAMADVVAMEEEITMIGGGHECVREVVALVDTETDTVAAVEEEEIDRGTAWVAEIEIAILNKHHETLYRRACFQHLSHMPAPYKHYVAFVSS